MTAGGGLRRQGPMHNSESDPELRVRERGGRRSFPDAALGDVR